MPLRGQDSRAADRALEGLKTSDLSRVKEGLRKGARSPGDGTYRARHSAASRSPVALSMAQAVGPTPGRAALLALGDELSG
jgi:hypothetical protein